MSKSIDRITLIIVDQLRADYLPLLPRCSLLLPHKAVCETKSIPASTEAMHANISTGLFPREHGFVSKVTSEGDEGLEQLEGLFDAGHVSSISSTAAGHGFDTYVIGGKPEAVLTMGREEECALRIHYDKKKLSFISVGRKKALFDDLVRILDSEQYKDVKPENLDGRVLSIAEIVTSKVASPNSLFVITLPSLDKLGHIYGPNSAETTRHLAFLDGAIERVIGLTGGSNAVIVTGDHGCRTTTRYLIEADSDDPRRFVVYTWNGIQYKFLEEHRIDSEGNLRKIQYDGGILRLWFGKTPGLLSENDSEFLGRYGTMCLPHQEGCGALMEVYRQSRHTNSGDITVVADSDVTFCKSGWVDDAVKQDKIARILPLDRYDLPIGEHGTHHPEDSEVGIMSNHEIGTSRICNTKIKSFVERMMALSKGK